MHVDDRVRRPSKVFARQHALLQCRPLCGSWWSLIDRSFHAGRFSVRDPELSLAIVAGAALCLGRLLRDHPDRDDAEAADEVTEDLLRRFDIPADDARDICRRPAPDRRPHAATPPCRLPFPDRVGDAARA